MRMYLWRYFAVRAIVNTISLTIIFGLGMLIIPSYVWMFTHKFEWMPFNRWLGYTLLGVPIGIMAAGMLTLYEWTQRTDAPVMKRLVIIVLISTMLIGGSIAAAKGLKLLLLI